MTKKKKHIVLSEKKKYTRMFKQECVSRKQKYKEEKDINKSNEVTITGLKEER